MVLCADNNPAHARSTIHSIRNVYGAVNTVVALGERLHEEDEIMLRKLCPTCRGRNTITSLINAGMKEARAEWNIVVIGGAYVPRNLDNKFSFFIERDTDILYPIVDGKYHFGEATINGLCMHRKTFRKVGDFAEENPLEICKMFWAMEAICQGCQFKGVIGAKIC